MFKSCLTQYLNDHATQASNEVKVWLWHNALTKDLQAISYIFPFDLFSLLGLVLQIQDCPITIGSFLKCGVCIPIKLLLHGHQTFHVPYFIMSHQTSSFPSPICFIMCHHIPNFHPILHANHAPPISSPSHFNKVHTTY